MPLTLRQITKNDYLVSDDGEPVGRIRLASERRGEVWMWSITYNHPGAGLHHGVEPTRDEAAAKFKSAWLAFRATIPRWNSGGA